MSSTYSGIENSFKGDAGDNNPYSIEDKYLPLFEVELERPKPFDNTWKDPNDPLVFFANDEPKVETFINSFQRAYYSMQVDLNKHWSAHLRFCFRKNRNALIWYEGNIKEEEEKKLTWNQVKDLLIKRFGQRPRVDLAVANQMLQDVRQNKDEPILDYLDRFGYFMIKAEADMEEKNIFLMSHFFNTFRGGDKFRTELIKFLDDCITAEKGERFTFTFGPRNQVFHLSFRKIYDIMLNHISDIYYLFDESEKENIFSSNETDKRENQGKKRNRRNKNSPNKQSKKPRSS